VLGGSASSKGGGGGTALTAAQRTELEGYIARLVTALRQNHEKPPGLSDLLSTDVEFLIAADGTISRVHVVRSSGNAAFDESCIEAFARMGSVGPKPDGKSDTWVLTFRMKEE
jgi:colicin import membrane protein